MTQLASLDVPTPPVPEHDAPPQAAELVGEVSRRSTSTSAGSAAGGRR